MDRHLPAFLLLATAQGCASACSRPASSSKATPARPATAPSPAGAASPDGALSSTTASPRASTSRGPVAGRDPRYDGATPSPSVPDGAALRDEPDREAEKKARNATLLQWTHSSPTLGAVPVVVRVPGGPVPKGGFAVLVAFHGRGESKKPPQRGAHGWLTDYHLDHALSALAAPPLSARDLGGWVTGERLAQLNAQLEHHPFQEPLLVFPYVPDLFKGEELFENGPEMARLVVEEIIPRLAREVPHVSQRWGVDGVSLGGRVALLVGLSYPARFSSVASTQAALDERELPRLVSLAERAQKAYPALTLRVLSSHDDYFLEVLTDFSEQLHTQGVRHQFDVVTGDHSYAFNRGPAGIEMLTFFCWTVCAR